MVVRGLGIDGFNAHQAHQSLNAFAIHRMALPTQVRRHLARAIERRLQILLIHQPHQLQVLPCLLGRRQVEGGAIETNQFTLSPYTQLRMVRLNQRPLRLN